MWCQYSTIHPNQWIINILEWAYKELHIILIESWIRRRVAHRQKDKARRNPLGCAAPVKPLQPSCAMRNPKKKVSAKNPSTGNTTLTRPGAGRKSPLDRSNMMYGLSWGQDVEVKCENGLSHFGSRGAGWITRSDSHASQHALFE